MPFPGKKLIENTSTSNSYLGIIIFLKKLNRDIPLLKFFILQIIAIFFANHFIIPFAILLIIILLSVILSTSRYYFLIIPVLVVSIIMLRCQLVTLDYFEDEIEIINQPLIVKYVAGTGINQKLTIGLPSLNGDIIFSRKEEGPNVLPGDTLWMSGILIIPENPTNQCQFNYRQY